MTRRPIASVRILTLPQLHPDAVRVEIDCPDSTTGITSLPGPVALLVPALITAACFEHEARCGACDVSEAHAQGHRALRDETERIYAAVQQRWLHRHAEGRRN
jgi:hypothetical protein